jgi:hypothetical protein
MDEKRLESLIQKEAEKAADLYMSQDGDFGVECNIAEDSFKRGAWFVLSNKNREALKKFLEDSDERKSS